MNTYEVPYIEAHNLAAHHFGRTLFEDVSLQVRRGELLAIVGPNGSGKTPLLLTLAGRMKPAYGSLRVGAFRLPCQRAKILRRVGLALFEGANDLQDSLTVHYATKMELELFGRPSRRSAVDAYLAEWELSKVARVRVKNLPAKTKAQVGIALAFVGNPQAVVVDDVESRLTLLESKDLMALLLQCARARHVAVAVGVTESLLAKTADEVFHLGPGR